MNKTTLIECDFCSDMSEEAWYISHEGFQFVVTNGILGERVNIDTGKMAACPTCWPLVQAKNLDGLIAHFFERHPNYSTARARQTVELYLRGYHGGVLDRLSEHVEHVTWASPKPQSPRFYTYSCRDCGAPMEVDGASYDRSIELKCPSCGRDIYIVGRPDLATQNLS